MRQRWRKKRSVEEEEERMDRVNEIVKFLNELNQNKEKGKIDEGMIMKYYIERNQEN